MADFNWLLWDVVGSAGDLYPVHTSVTLELMRSLGLSSMLSMSSMSSLIVVVEKLGVANWGLCNQRHLGHLDGETRFCYVDFLPASTPQD